MTQRARHLYLAAAARTDRASLAAELLGALGQRVVFSSVVCVAARDALDAAAAALRRLAAVTHLHVLHAEQLPDERAVVLRAFAAEREGRRRGDSGDVAGPPSAVLLLATEAALPGRDEEPLGVELLVNVGLPVAREPYQRRKHAALGPSSVGSSPRLVLNVVSASEAPELRALEVSLGLPIEEMPVDVGSLFA